MAATREAKIKFSADTREFTQEIQQANSTMAGLKAELKLAEATFQATGDKAQFLADKQRILAQEMSANEQKQAALAQKVEAAARAYGEGSREATEWATKLTRAKTEHAQLEAAIRGCDREIDELNDDSRAAARELDDLGDAAKQAGDGLNSPGWTQGKQILADLATDVLQRAADAAVDAAKAMVEVGSNFEAAMSEVEAISGAADAELDQMAAKAKELGSTTKFSATEVAEGFKYMSLAGWDTAEMMDAIDGVVNLAAASEMELGEASDMVTDYLSAFGLSASDAGKMVDEMVFAQSNSNTSTKQLGDAFGNCAANMHSAGQSMETTTAILEAMANQGTKGSEAGTALSAVMRDITQKMADGAISIGDTSVAVTDADGNFRDLTDILVDVQEATDGMGTAQRASALSSTFTARSIKAVNEVLTEGAENVKEYALALEDSDGAASTAAATMMDNFKGAVTEAQSAAEGLGVAIFERVSGPLTGVVDVATDAMGAITEALTPPPKSDLENFLDDVKAKIEDTRATIESLGNVDMSVNADIASIEQYRDVLEKATKGEELSEFEKYQLQKAVESLDGVIPGLAEAYDKEKSSIDMTTDAMKEYIKTAEQQIELRAYEGVLENASKAHAEAELEVARATSARKEAQKQLNEAMKDLPVEMQEMIKNGADVSTVFNEMRERGVSLYEETESAVKKYSGALDDANESLEKAKKNEEDSANILAETEGLYSKKARSLNQYSKTNNVLAKDIKDGTRAQEEQAEAMRAGIPIGEGFVNMNESMARVISKTGERAQDTADAVQDEADTVENATDQEAKAIEESGLSWMKRQNVASAALENTIKLSEQAAERAKASAEAEKSALETTRQAYESNYNSIKDTVSEKISLFDAFDGGQDMTVEQMLSNLESQTAGIRQYKQEMAEVIAAYGDELGPDLVNTLQSMGADAANTWHHMWVTMSQDNAPDLFRSMGEEWAAGLDLADQIASYCAGNLTAYQLATGDMGSTRIEWTGLRESVQEMTPELDAAIQAAQAAGVAIPDGLAEGLASGETSTTSAVQQITSSLQGTFNGLYEIAQASGADIPAGLTEGIDGSAASYEAAIGTLTEALSTAGYDAGAAAAEGTSSGLSDNTSSVEGAAGDTASAAATAADGKKSEFQTAGSTAGTEYESGIKSQVSAVRSAGQQLAKAGAEGAREAGSAFKDISREIDQAMDDAVDSIQRGVSQMRSALNVKLRGPDIAVPHFSMHGSFNAKTNSVPSVSVSWYAKGAVFDQPVIIPTMYGLKGVGEAGPEAVSPVDVLQRYVTEAVEAAAPQIDYRRLGAEVAAACAKMNISMDIDGKTLGRVVRRVQK